MFNNPGRKIIIIIALWLYIGVNDSVCQELFGHQPLIEDELTQGVVWRYYHYNTSDGMQSINILILDQTTNNYRLSIAIEDTSLVYTSELAIRNKALAAINGSFFDMKKGGSVVFLQKDKNVINQSVRKDRFTDEAAFAIDKKGEVSIIKKPDDGWKKNGKYHDILSSGPLLLFHGQEEAITDDAFNNNRHPRTAIGLTAGKQLLLVTVDGRNKQAIGMSIAELSQLMQETGCTDALNLDGGGSTTFWIKDRTANGIVNYPSDNKTFDHKGERKIANAILVLPVER